MNFRHQLRYTLLVALAGFLGGGEMRAQSFLPTEPLRLAVDVARFRGYDDSTVNVEVYYSFPQRSLTYKTDTSGFLGALDLTVLIRVKDSVVAADRWLVPHTIRDTTVVQPGMNLVGVHKIALTSGIYGLVLIARDRNNPGRVDSVALRVPVNPFRTERMALSDLEFASSVRQDASPGLFYKNTLEVVPNANGLFSGEQACFVYAEAYNLLSGTDRSDYTVRLTVYDAVNKEIVAREKFRKRTLESTVLVDNIAVHKLRSGTYTAVLSIVDTAKKPIVSTAKKFFVYNARLGVDSSLVAGKAGVPLGIYLSMEEPELDREFRWLKYEATDAEKVQYEQLKGMDAKRKFLSDFWRRRGPEVREQYLKRVGEVNTAYGILGREGYRTDRGRVYIMYGPPSDYDRHPNEPDTRPYEIWQYNDIQGGVIFVFVQRTSGGDYELVHSTHRNELHDENWDRVGITR
jgi:GWxTD domain-containing protein